MIKTRSVFSYHDHLPAS